MSILQPSDAPLLQFGYSDLKPQSGRSSLLVRALQREGFPIKCLLVHPASRGKSLQLAWNVLAPPPARVVFLRFPYFPWMVRCAVAIKKKLKAVLVVDAMVSAYETIVEDRKLCEPGTREAKACIAEDEMVGAAADLLVVDTLTHASDLAGKWRCGLEKMVCVPVGSPLAELGSIAAPVHRAGADPVVRVVYLGSYVPLHGIDVIVGAAALLQQRAPQVRFKLIGGGQHGENAKRLADGLTNIEFHPPVSGDVALAGLVDADIVLGIFGASKKAQLVVPFKAFDALALGKPLITARTLGAEELLNHQKDAWLVPANPESLAEAILHLASSHALRFRLSETASAVYRERFHSSVAVKPLTKRIVHLLS